MQEFAPLKSTAPDGPCPSAEDLAAYIDGTLGAKDSERVDAHLASCGECYAVYMESLRFELESRPAEPVGVVDYEIARFRPRDGVEARRYASHAVRWLSIAALLLVGVGTGIYLEFLAPPPNLRTAQMTPPLPSLPNGTEPMWLGPTYRGGDVNEDAKLDETSFRMGVQIVNLRAALKAGKVKEAQDVVARILGLLKPQPFSDDLQKGYTAVTVALENGKSPGELLTEAARLGQVYRKDFEPGTAFDFGQWVEAGHLAAQLRDPSFFQRADTRAFLRRFFWRDKLHSLLRIRDAKLDPDIQMRLGRTSAIVSAGNFRTAEYAELERQLQPILEKYYPDR